MSDSNNIRFRIDKEKSDNEPSIDVDKIEMDEQINRKKLENKRFESDTNDRKWLAQWAAVVVSLWLIFVVGILIGCAKVQIHLSDTVLITLLGTTTLNVLGLSFIVLRGHFNQIK